MTRFLMALCLTFAVSLAFAGDYHRNHSDYRCDEDRDCRCDRHRSYHYDDERPSRYDDQRSYRRSEQRPYRAPHAITVRQPPQKEPQGYDRIRNHMEGRPNQVEQEKSTLVIVVPAPGYGYNSPVIIQER